MTILIRRKGISLIKLLISLITINLILTLSLHVPLTSSNAELHLDKAFERNGAVPWAQRVHPGTVANSVQSPRFQSAHTHVIFYNIFLNAQSRSTFFRSLKIVDEQLKQIPNRSKIFFSLIGSERFYGNSGHDICHKFPELNCTLLGDFRDGGEELTLQALYDYCLEHTLEIVSYIHNKGSFRHSSGNTKNRRRATLGAVSDECLQMPLSPDYPCNICGTKFQYKPHLLFQANMWTAKCSYIRQLVPPIKYESKRRALFKTLWENNTKCLSRQPDLSMEQTNWAWNLTDNLFLRNVGLGRYALERWMLHHPSMVPCDLLPNSTLRSLDVEETRNLTLTPPIEMGKSISQKVKARQSWLLQKEYAAFYPNTPINDILVKDQAKPTPHPCL